MSQELLLETQAGYFYELLDDAYILHLCMSDAIPELPKHLSDSHCLNATWAYQLYLNQHCERSSLFDLKAGHSHQTHSKQSR